MDMEVGIFVTAEDGSTVKVTGPEKAVDKIIAAIEAAGARYNAAVDCWDFGFYAPAGYLKRAPLTPS